ncbi:Edc3p [Sporobolomyces salmoneus]|uniref:Edc3p n=1 Tax=Sporobolomyces salmoneus TaxID=183962 RepID=UPI00316E1E67
MKLELFLFINTSLSHSMAASFVGLPVLIQLRGGGTAKGIVAGVDGGAGTIELVDAQITTSDGTRIERRASFGRNEVAGLELLAVKKAEPVSPLPLSPPPPRQPPSQSSQQRQQQRPLQPWQAEDSDFDNSAPISNYSPHSSPKPSTPRSQRQRGARGNNHNRRGKPHAEWDDGEGGDEAESYAPQARRNHQPNSAADSFDEDFDFGAGLQSFNKKAVFENIRANDTIDPALRLVAHNRNSNRTPQSKLLPSESVLTVEELEAQQLDRKVALEDAAVPKLVQQKRGMTVEELERGVASVELDQEEDRGYEYENERGPVMTESGITVPAVKLRQWKEALSIAEIESSPSPSQRLELAAYQLTTFVLSHLALKFGLFPIPCLPQSRPSVLLLCTDCEKSNVALRAGILLANRGCRVVALVEDGKTEELKTNLRVLSSSGGRIVRELDDLPPTFNLVIEALNDSEASSSSLSSSLSSPSLGTTSKSEFSIAAAQWINRLDAAVITCSIDVPFGISHDEGTSIAPVFVTPTFIFSRALPRPGAVALLSNLEISPQLFVADVGFAPSIWERIGVEEFETALWGGEGIVRVSIDGRT